jgi:hypothetical protein
MFLVRLVSAPFILIGLLVAAVFLVVFAGVAWIFYGDAYLRINWPHWI